MQQITDKNSVSGEPTEWTFTAVWTHRHACSGGTLKKEHRTQSSSIIKVDVTEPMKCLIAALTTLKSTWEDFVRDGKYTGFVSQQVYSQPRVPVGLCPFGFSLHSPLWHLSNTGDNTPSTPTKHYHPQVMLPNTVRLKGQACSLCLLILPLPWWLRVPSQCRY